MIKNILSAGIVALTFGLVLGGSNLAFAEEVDCEINPGEECIMPLTGEGNISGELAEPNEETPTDPDTDTPTQNTEEERDDETENTDENAEESEPEEWPMYLALGALGAAILVFIILNLFGGKKKQSVIAHIAGIITEKFQNSVIVDVNGVGYELTISAPDVGIINLDEKIKFYTYHAIRENAEELYGFSSLAAKKLFEMLISVNGVGPKAAMAILSLGNPEDVRNAIANDDAAFISKASGVGKKSAERVIVDLRDKVGLPSHYGRSPEAIVVNAKGPEDEALDALIALGFPLKEATTALADVDSTLPVEERVRLALKQKQYGQAKWYISLVSIVFPSWPKYT